MYIKVHKYIDYFLFVWFATLCGLQLTIMSLFGAVTKFFLPLLLLQKQFNEKIGYMHIYLSWKTYVKLKMCGTAKIDELKTLLFSVAC